MMNEENIKDLRLMLDMLTKDYLRLADDMRELSNCLRSLQMSLILKEKQGVEYIKPV